VFYRLRELRPGDEVLVVRADRRMLRFVVESLASYPKQALPGERLYGPTTAPALRLAPARARRAPGRARRRR
jgi:hypothetical protein